MQGRGFVVYPRMQTGLKLRDLRPRLASCYVARGKMLQKRKFNCDSYFFAPVAQRVPTFIVRAPNCKFRRLTCSIHQIPRGGLPSRQYLKERARVEMEHPVDGWRARKHSRCLHRTAQTPLRSPPRKEPDQHGTVFAYFQELSRQLSSARRCWAGRQACTGSTCAVCRTSLDGSRRHISRYNHGDTRWKPKRRRQHGKSTRITTQSQHENMCQHT
jgi:hypothetical protein